jgi:hypothetical protein
MAIDTIAGVDAHSGGAGGTLTAMDFFPVPPYAVFAQTYQSMLIDAATEKTAFLFYAPKTGSIDRLCFMTQTVTLGTTVDVRLETVDTATGNPSGTLVGTNTNASQVIADANDSTWFEVTLTAAASVTAGQFLALVVANSGSGNLNIGATNAGTGMSSPIPGYTSLYTGTWTLNAGRMGIGAVRYDDGSYPHVSGLFPITSLATATDLHTGTTPDEVGNIFVAPISCTVAGLYALIINWAPADTFELVLYEVSGGTVLAAATGGGQSATTPNKWWQFATPQDITAGDTYRVVVKPTAATALRILDITVNTAAKDSMAGIGTWGMTRCSRTNAGAWDDTATTRQTACGLIVSHVMDT